MQPLQDEGSCSDSASSFSQNKGNMFDPSYDHHSNPHKLYQFQCNSKEIMPEASVQYSLPTERWPFEAQPQYRHCPYSHPMNIATITDHYNHLHNLNVKLGYSFAEEAMQYGTPYNIYGMTKPQTCQGVLFQTGRDCVNLHGCIDVY